MQRVEYIIELLMLRIFEVKVQQDPEFAQLRDLFRPGPGAVDEKDRERDKLPFSSLLALPNRTSDRRQPKWKPGRCNRDRRGVAWVGSGVALVEVVPSHLVTLP